MRKIEKFISKANLKKALKGLLKDAVLIGPVESYGDIVFQEAESADDIVLDYENCLNAPKDYMFLNDESLLEYDLKKLKVKKNSTRLPKAVIFGSRACDTRAVGLLDKFFLRQFEDPLYFSKRNRILIITLMCEKLGRGCFCTSTHSGPYLDDGYDVQLVGVDGGYFLEAASSKGKDFVGKFSGLMKGVDTTIRKKKEKAVNSATESKRPEFDLKKVYHNLDNSKAGKRLWEDLAQRCQSCGGCLLICPACSCFYVSDKRISDKEGARVRSLDACFYKGFTRMAGGYNPVASGLEMMQRKFYHKLHQQLDEFNEPGCTGCGRCNDICPGNINWLEVIKKIGAQ